MRFPLLILTAVILSGCTSTKEELAYLKGYKKGVKENSEALREKSNTCMFPRNKVDKAYAEGYYEGFDEVNLILENKNKRETQKKEMSNLEVDDLLGDLLSSTNINISDNVVHKRRTLYDKFKGEERFGPEVNISLSDELLKHPNGGYIKSADFEQIVKYKNTSETSLAKSNNNLRLFVYQIFSDKTATSILLMRMTWSKDQTPMFGLIHYDGKKCYWVENYTYDRFGGGFYEYDVESIEIGYFNDEREFVNIEKSDWESLPLGSILRIKHSEGYEYF